MAPRAGEKDSAVPPQRSPFVAAILAWLVPGLGHWYIGERTRAVILFVVMTVTFWTGVAVGGVRSTVTPKENGLWVAAQLCMGPQAATALYLSNRAAQWPDQARIKAPWPASNISVVYTGIVGLLNLLIMIDVLARSDPSQVFVVTSSRAPPDRGGR